MENDPLLFSKKNWRSAFLPHQISALHIIKQDNASKEKTKEKQKEKTERERERESTKEKENRERKKRKKKRKKKRNTPLPLINDWIVDRFCPAIISIIFVFKGRVLHTASFYDLDMPGASAFLF